MALEEKHQTIAVEVALQIATDLYRMGEPTLIAVFTAFRCTKVFAYAIILPIARCAGPFCHGQWTHVRGITIGTMQFISCTLITS